jgi:hypothetical protein
LDGLHGDRQPLPEEIRARRVGLNQSVFREVNERVVDLVSKRFDQEFEFLCECAHLDCSMYLKVRLEDYERVRTNGRRFFVAYGHEVPSFERVVETGPGWQVVEKVGIAGQTAADENPRAGAG